MRSLTPSWQLRPLVVAFVVFLVAVVLAAGVISRLVDADTRSKREHASLEAANHASALQRGIERSLSVTYALAALVRQGDGTISNFDAVGHQALLLYPGVLSVSLAPAGVIRSIVPLVGNERAVGLDVLASPRTANEAAAARDSRKLTLAGPFRLEKGNLAAIGRLPIFLDDSSGTSSFWGFVNVEIGFPEALEAAGLIGLTQQGFAYQLWRVHPDTGQRQIIVASSPRVLIEPVHSTIEVPNATWTLSVAPFDGWRADPLAFALEAALALFVCALLGYVAKLLVELQAHGKGLEALVAQRTFDIKAREADLNRAQSVAQIGSWVLHLPENWLRCSAEAGRIIGVKADTLLSQEAFLQHVHPEDRGAVDRAWQELLKGQRLDIEHRIVREGAACWVRQQANSEFAPDGTLRSCVGTVQDITERKQATEALVAAGEQFRGLVEQAIAGIFIVQGGKLVYANQRAAEIVGQGAADEVIGTDPLAAVVEADRGKVAESMRRLLDGESRNLALEFGVLRRDGVVVQVGVNGARATHEGQPAIIGVVQDISEKKRAEEEIRRYVEQLENAFMSAVEVATVISELRDPYTAGHERRVAQIAVAIGAELGFDARRQEGLRVAGHLHDIGKITIPSEILTKPGKLGAIEFQLVQGHAQASYEVLKGVEFPWPVAQVALQHHERMDGSGYPQGLTGDAILLEARILAVADVVEAMSTHRPYRPGLGSEMALAEIERGRGAVYDADVADACLRLFRQKSYQLPL